MPKNNHAEKFWNFTNENNDPELILYGDISSNSWWGDEITPQQFSDDLKALGDVSEITVRINSGGGDVFAAFAIYSQLKDHKAKINVKIDGWAASAATIIAMAGDTISIPAAGIFMIHNPAVGLFGHYTEKELPKLTEELKIIKNSIIQAYTLKTGKSEEEISEIMDNETWYDGKEAVNSGFCDNIMFEDIDTEIENKEKIIVNSVVINVSDYKNMPKKLLNSGPKEVKNVCFSNKIPENQKEEQKQMEIKTVEDLKTAYPDLAKQVADEAANAERKRIQDIESGAIDGFENLVEDAKFSNPISASEVALKILNQMKKQGEQYLNNCKNDIEDSGINEVHNVNTETGAKGEKNPYMKVINKVLPIAK